MDRQRLIEECRLRWNEFDPIGIRRLGATHSNEYDSYLRHTAHLLSSGADPIKIAGTCGKSFASTCACRACPRTESSSSRASCEKWCRSSFVCLAAQSCPTKRSPSRHRHVGSRLAENPVACPPKDRRR